MFEHLSDEELLNIKKVLNGASINDPIMEDDIKADVEIIKNDITSAENIIMKYDKFTPIIMVRFVRVLVETGIPPKSYIHLPVFNDIVSKYKPLLIKVRDFNPNNGE